MEFSLAYGDDTISAEIPWGRCLGTLDIGHAPALADPEDALDRGMAQPIGLSGSLYETFAPGQRVLIVVSDSFRYTGIEKVLPRLLSRLAERGVAEEDIEFLVATGTHRGPTEEEAAKILGKDIYPHFASRMHTHEPFDLDKNRLVGTTSRGTPVWVNYRLLDADRVLVTGSVILHYFGGFGGGRKSVVPGCAAEPTIAANHARNLHPTENALNPAVRIGTLDGNPVAEDMLEAAKFVRVDGIINTVLNRNNEIAGLYVGDMDAAHREACAFAHDMYCVQIPEQADLVLATGGKAKNFIQSHKALFNAYQAMKPGGRMLFAARAQEGYGGNKFQQWLDLRTCDAVIEQLRKNAEINGQTALSTLEKAPSAVMVSDLTEEQVTRLGARKAATLDAALEQLRSELTANGVDNPTYYYMPSAPYTVPVLT
jgi:nickel-dependent lactate racemase